MSRCPNILMYRLLATKKNYNIIDISYNINV